MSWNDEAEKTYTPEKPTGEWVPAVILDEWQARIKFLETEVSILSATPLAEAFFRAQSEVARLTAQVAELKWREALLTRMVVATREYRSVDMIRADHDLAEAGFPWPEGAAEAGGEGHE